MAIKCASCGQEIQTGEAAKVVTHVMNTYMNENGTTGVFNSNEPVIKTKDKGTWKLVGSTSTADTETVVKRQEDKGVVAENEPLNVPLVNVNAEPPVNATAPGATLKGPK